MLKNIFFLVLKDQKLLHVDDLTIGDYRLQREVAKIRYRDGVATSYDVLNAEVNLSNARLTEVTDRNQFRVDRLSLDRAMGVVSNSPYRVAPLSELPIPRMNPDNAVALALRNRPDLKQLTQQALAQKQVVKFNQAQFFPTIQTVGSYNLDSEFFPGLQLVNRDHVDDPDFQRIPVCQADRAGPGPVETGPFPAGGPEADGDRRSENRSFQYRDIPGKSGSGSGSGPPGRTEPFCGRKSVPRRNGDLGCRDPVGTGSGPGKGRSGPGPVQPGHCRGATQT